MIRSLPPSDWLTPGPPILDVRSPGEYARGHIPGARNLPLFSDAERAVVGTLYKQQGRDQAMLEGLRIVGPKLAALVEVARALAPEGRIRVHCWRGGERSGSVAWLLDKAGFAEVITLKGGYKAFRNHVLAGFDAPLDLRVLGGATGTGKTATLQHLQELGEQIIDLEALAHHKGSSFGGLGEAPQPTTEHFENTLWQVLQQLDPARPVWVEDEALMIGKVRLPDGFHARMREAWLYFVHMPAEERAERLVEAYGGFPPEQLAEAILRIRKRLGPQHCKAALEALAAGDLRAVALISLRYYDKAYQRDLECRSPDRLVPLSAHAGDLRDLAQRLQQHAREQPPAR